MERGEANNIDPLIAQRLEGPHNRSSWPEWINSAFLKDIETVYAAIAHGPKVGGDEINAELGRWVNIISYVLDNSLDGTLNEIQARELIARTKTVVSFLLKEPTAGGLVFAREVRHEILMDIYRAEPISRHIIKITNGSPSFAVVLGVAASAILLLILAMILPPIFESPWCSSTAVYRPFVFRPDATGIGSGGACRLFRRDSKHFDPPRAVRGPTRN